MLVEEKENKHQKNEHFKDVIIATLVLIISIGCFFTYNPAGAKLTVGTDGMTFATYPLGVATLLTFLGLIYFFIQRTLFCIQNMLFKKRRNRIGKNFHFFYIKKGYIIEPSTKKLSSL